MLPKIVLAFDTSAAHCAAALLLADGTVLARQEEMAKGQAERLMPLLEELLAEAGLTWADLSALGVGTGPGNFTGVRIAVAAARGLALALKIPAIGVTALETLAYGLPRPLRVIEDARRSMVYVQDFFADHAEPARLAALEELEAFEGAETGSAAKAPLPAAMGFAEALVRLAAARLAQEPNPPRPAPFYLRGADAAPPSDPPPVILDA